MTELEQLLIDRGIEFKINANNPFEVNMKCFSGLHEDSNPSLSYNIEKEVFNCFACGFKGDSVKLMKELGIVSITSPLSKQGFKIKRLLEKLDAVRDQKPIHLPEPRFPVKYSFKGVSAKTLAKFEAFTTTYDNMDDYICVPVYQGGKLKFIEGRHTQLTADKATMPKYMRKPAGVDVASVLFPLDAVTDFTQIILVEGLFDVLNMHDLGYTNTLCMFGTNNFNAQKAKMLDERGCRHVIIMMDGDTAGVQAAVRIQTLLTQRSIHTTVINMAEGQDPGSIDVEEASAYLSQFVLD